MKISHDLQKCINCGSCVALCPKFFELKEDKVLLIDGKENQEAGKSEREVDKADCSQDAANACPVNAIEVK